MKTLTKIPQYSHHMLEAKTVIPDFRPNPYWTPDPLISGHGVFSGILTDGNEIIVKPHTVTQRAYNEAGRINSVIKLGINTPNLHGVYLGNYATYLAVDRYKGLQTLGQLNLDVDIADRSLHRLIKPAISTAVNGIADMHLKGVVHGDYQAKNAAFGPENEFVAIDLEKSQPNVSLENGHNGRANDLYLLGASLLLSRLISGRKPPYRAGFVSAHVLGEYAESVNQDSDFIDYEKITDAYEKVAKTSLKARFSKL